jgi:ABC-type dipeptide/oligopeptide/nickel transport system permease component
MSDLLPIDPIGVALAASKGDWITARCLSFSMVCVCLPIIWIGFIALPGSQWFQTAFPGSNTTSASACLLA